MKYILYVFAFVFVCACKKDKTHINTTLYGKWKLAETMVGTGGPIQITAADPKNPVYIAFKDNGEYVNSTIVNNPARFQIDSNTVTITSNLQLTQPITYRYTIENGTLKLSPIRPYLCIEGCYTKYISVR